MAKNKLGTDPSPIIIYFRADWDPLITGLESIKVDMVDVLPIDGKYYIKPGILRVKTKNFVDHENNPKEMYMMRHPKVELKIGDALLIQPFSYEWYKEIRHPSTYYYYISSFAITTGNAPAILTVTDAEDVNGNKMEPFVFGDFIIDTTLPSVVEVKIDEDSDGDFTDNNGYCSLNEQPTIWVKFSERIKVVTSSFTPYGMRPISLTHSWVPGTDQHQSTFTLPSPITSTTGDGPARITLFNITDNAGNILPLYTVDITTIDATPPSPPIFITSSTAVPRGSLITIKLQDPIETDINYAIFYGRIPKYDFKRPYEVILPALLTPIIVRYVDFAGNISSPSSLPITLLPQIDTTPPRAKLTAIGLGFTPILTATTNSGDTKEIKFEYSYDRVKWHEIGTVLTSPYQVRWDISKLPNGIYYIRTIATDINGNTDTDPTIIEVRRHTTGLSIEKDAAKVYKKININLSFNTSDSKLTVNINSKNKPVIEVNLYSLQRLLIDSLMAPEITLTGTAYNYSATISADLIKSGGFAEITVTHVDDNGETSIEQRWLYIIPVDHKTRCHTGYYFREIDIPPYTIGADNTLLFQEMDTLAIGLDEILPLKGADVRWLTPTKMSKNIKLPFNYTTVEGFYQDTTAHYSKFTVLRLDGTKWTNEGITIVGGPTPDRIEFTTSELSYFALVADYSKPKIEKLDFVGNVLYGKVKDTGSGIQAANIVLEIDGRTYTAAEWRNYYDSQTGDFHIVVTHQLLPGIYSYTFRTTDNVGNTTSTFGTLNYTAAFEMKEAHNYPNPFNPDKEVTKIQFILGEDSEIEIRIFDFNGELVYQTRRWSSRGVNEVPWDGTNTLGKKVANGIYFCQVKGKDKTEIFKIAVVRE